MRGLGDLVALVAEPVKRAGVRYGPGPVRRWLENCRCAERREAWNRAVPFS